MIIYSVLSYGYLRRFLECDLFHLSIRNLIAIRRDFFDVINNFTRGKLSPKLSDV